MKGINISMKKYKKRFMLKVCIVLALCLLQVGSLAFSLSAENRSCNSDGRWMTGEYHAHTTQSNDAGETYNTVEDFLNAAFREDLDKMPQESMVSLNYGKAFDYIAISEHLRNSYRDPDGNDIFGACWEAIKDQQEKVKELQSKGKYLDKIIYSGFEWDMMGLDHAAVAIIDSEHNEVPINAIHQFEWLYSYDTSDELFNDNELEKYGPRQNEKTNKENNYSAIKWIKENYPESYVLLNHPSRHNGSDYGVVAIEDIRKLNDLAPNIVFGFEGMPGNQMSPENNRAETSDIYGGADVMIAKVGGIWDALLGEGRHFWNFANSDFHFKISSNGLYSSGYWPSEYSRNYTWIKGNTFKDVVRGMRSGKSFSVYGDLINALDFKVSNRRFSAKMGQHLISVRGDLITITIRFKSPKYNNYSAISEHNAAVTNNVKVDHIDLISGEVTGKISKEDYATNTTNETTRVIARFFEQDWGKPDEDGYYTIEYTTTADTNRYYRLRGTNLGVNVSGETDAHGNPLQDESFSSIEDNLTRFNHINDRNYSDMWFYSNPIFVNVYWRWAPLFGKL
jgi:hypothetical protein